jgi:hypothetical protein
MKAEVKFRNGSFCLNLGNGNLWNLSDFFAPCSMNKILGNIHDNPELLENKETTN